MKFGTTTHGTQGTKRKASADPLTFPAAPSTGQGFNIYKTDYNTYDLLLPHPDIGKPNLTLGVDNLIYFSSFPYQGMKGGQNILHLLCNIPPHVSHMCLPNTITDCLWNTFLILLCTSSTSVPFTGGKARPLLCGC